MAWDVKEVEVLDCLIGEFAVSFRVSSEDENWWLTWIYGQNKYRKRGMMWDEL